MSRETKIFLLKIFLLITCWTRVSVVQARVRYCDEPDLYLKLDSAVWESFFPRNRKVGSSSPSNCTWKVQLADANVPRNVMLVLQGYDTSKKRWRRSVPQEIPQTIRYELSAPPRGCSLKQSEGGNITWSREVFRLLPVTKGSTLTVTYVGDASDRRNLRPALQIKLMLEDYCSEEIVSFDKRCYNKSEVSRNMADELRYFNDNSPIVQLASFNSTAAIRQFLEINKRTFVQSGEQVRKKIPLNLTKPVRIGLFLDKKSGRVSYLFINASDNQCQLKEIEDKMAINASDLSNDPTHACGSLRVDALSGRAVVEFRDCSESLPALISFAETPMEICSKCSEAVDSWLSYLRKTDAEKFGVLSLELTIGLTLLGIFVPIVIVCIVCILRKYQSRKRRQILSHGKPFLAPAKNDCETFESTKPLDPLMPLSEKC